MKFAILSGAYINAGDFLIVDRTIKLLQHIYPNCEIIKFIRNQPLDDKLEEINTCNALIIAGGPAYLNNMYPDVIPLVKNLEQITTKIVTIGLGWYGKTTTKKFIYNYKYSKKTKELLTRIIKDSKKLSCRDWYSVKTLQINGIYNAIMTGCPAWYNIDFLDKKELRKDINYSLKKICISDPANAQNIKQSLSLAKYLKIKYPKSQIYFVFHRIEKNSNKYKKLQEQLKQLNIKIIDITGSSEGFKIYDDCDLHIGYRVHAHIYNLSNRNISILIEEDGRGAGVNEALGLQRLQAYVEKDSITYKNNIIGKIIRKCEKILLKDKYEENKYIIEDVDNYIISLKSNNFIQFKTAFFNMQMYYKVMEEAIKDSIH